MERVEIAPVRPFRAHGSHADSAAAAAAQSGARDPDGSGPTHMAALNGHIEVLRFLHEAGVDLQQPGNVYLSTDQDEKLRTGVTPLADRNCNGHVTVM